MQKHNMCPPAGGKCQNCWGRQQGYAGLLVLMDSYIRNAKKNNRKFDITQKEFGKLTSSKCHYCSSLPSMIKRGGKYNQKSVWGNYQYNGIDRVDNSIGYVKSNCVPCCVICNRAKNKMTYNDFMCYINRIKSS